MFKMYSKKPLKAGMCGMLQAQQRSMALTLAAHSVPGSDV